MKAGSAMQWCDRIFRLMRGMAGVKGQSTDADSVWFDNAVVIRLR